MAFSFPARDLAILALVGAAMGAPSAHTQQAATSPKAAAEGEYYRLETVPIPDDVVLEVGGLATLPDGRLAVSTRRGDVWVVDNPSGTRPHYTRFAQGLHESLGLAYRGGDFYAAQRGELTRLRDTSGDGVADEYETVYSWPLSGNYHEYSFGPLFTRDGNMLVTLNLAWIGRGASLAKWRGWALEITPDGKMTPIATGLRSPAGFGFNLDGDLFYAENQGDWVGSGSITHVEKGDFLGNPEGLRWTGEPESPLRLKPADIPDTGEPKYEVARRVKGLKPPSVWFPHTVLGISTSSILVDSTRGAFGPFHGQLFVGDQGHNKMMRVFLEKVDGVYQGAVFPFREGFVSGLIRQAWGKDGEMFVGMTNRGWNANGSASFGLQRLVWTGKVPFEAEKIEARPDGLEITFTRPADRATAGDPASYEVNGFTYHYHHVYGSPPINQQAHPVRGVVVSPDGLRARLVIDGLRPGYVHEVKMAGVRSGDAASLLHDVGYYTLNRVPGGARLTLPDAPRPAPAAASPRAATPASSGGAKRVTSMPAAWKGAVDVTIDLGTLPGLKFSAPELSVKAGSRVRLTFENSDDMLHNFVLVRPGAADAVTRASMEMGLQGPARHYVPPTDDVLHHTAILEPGRSESIYFVAPSRPGELPYICSFPGHGFVMRGVMRVTP